MSVSPSYPGLYIQEQLSSSHAIVPAPTSIAAFVGYSHPFKTQNFNVAQELFSFTDYETYFGPLFSSGLVDASLPRAVYQFFLNGGSTAYVVGLQPGLFDGSNTIITRLGPGGAAIAATATTTSGGTSAGSTFTIGTANPAPTLTSLSPASVAPASPQFTLTVTGSNFVSGAAINWNGTALPTTNFVNASELTALVPSSDVAAAANASVTVTNPAPGGGTSATALSFTVGGTNPVPTISSLSPDDVDAGAAFALTVNGGNFVPASVVNWNGTALTTTYVSASELTAAVPVADVGAAGTANVTVTNPSPGGGTSAAATFTIGTQNPAPTISSLSPASISPGSANFTLTVNGNNFVSGAGLAVDWNGSALTTAYVSASEITAAVPASDVSSAATVNVTVTNPGGATSAAATFTIGGSNPLPTISSLVPAGAMAGGAADIALTVNGSNFTPAAVVNWNGVPLATSFVSPTQLTATVPHADIANPGTVAVTVSNTASSGASGITFTARELTDIVPMTVTITNTRNGGATFDVAITYGSQVETYRGIQLAGAAGQLPDAMINALSALVQVSPAAAGWGTTIANQQLSLAYTVPATVATGFSASDFTVGDGSTIAVFEPNSSLDQLEIFNLLMVPGVTDFSVVSAALAFAERKRAFAIIDPPPQAPAVGAQTDAPQPIQYWMQGLGGPSGPSLPRSQNGALYFPYLISQDPITSNEIAMAPSGFVAGLYAATDAARGVWKAPAGLATLVLNTTGPVHSGALNDPQQGVLNLDSINCLRSFSGVGTVVWGARTLVASNVAFQQSMYVPVRRMTLFIEQTLLANLRWVVFEPNDEPLWTAIKASIEGFMLSLFRQGALQGSTPSQAFQVKCDSTTTTPDDQAQGIVNIVVAFAPLKPAEFVIIKIAQLAGQTAGS